VAFVSLAPLSDRALMVSTSAQPLGVQETAGQPLVETLTEALRSKQLSLVLLSRCWRRRRWREACWRPARS
jgi:predicted ATPase